MKTYDVDVGGVTYEVDAPDEKTAWAWANQTHQKSSEKQKQDDYGMLYNASMGALKGAADIGSTLLTPVDKLIGKTDRREQLHQFFNDNADADSTSFKVGDVAAGIAGTAGAGGALAKGLKFAPALANAVASGGFSLGSNATGSSLANGALRAVGGAANGALSAGMVNPDDALTGAGIGAVMPSAAQVAGKLGHAVGSGLGLSPGQVAPEVAALYQKAKSLGVDVPADRLVNSPFLNAVTSSLEYVPMSGRTATREGMESNLNKALTNTFGQDTPNVTMALRSAKSSLGNQFDSFLQNNQVKVDSQLTQDFADVLGKAKRELNPSDYAIVENQVKELMSKAQGGAIDGQAAYNIKKDLDRIGARNSNEATYAKTLKNKLIDAYGRSAGADEAAKFANLRKQYGNMKSVEKLAQNGAEGDISVARLAGMKNIGNNDLQDIADIAAQFVKPRESQHSAMQRLLVGGSAAGAGGMLGGLPLIAGGWTAAKLANALLNSDKTKQLMLNGGVNVDALIKALQNPAIRAAPAVISAQ